MNQEILLNQDTKTIADAYIQHLIDKKVLAGMMSNDPQLWWDFVKDNTAQAKPLYHISAFRDIEGANVYYKQPNGKFDLVWLTVDGDGAYDEALLLSSKGVEIFKIKLADKTEFSVGDKVTIDLLPLPIEIQDFTYVDGDVHVTFSFDGKTDVLTCFGLKHILTDSGMNFRHYKK